MDYSNPLNILCNDIIYNTSDSIFRLLSKYLTNIFQQPNNQKFRVIKLQNKSFECLWSYPECQELFFEIGFLLNDEKTLITLPMDVPLTNLNDCLNYFHEFEKQCKQKEQANLQMISVDLISPNQPIATTATPPQQTELHFAAMRGDVNALRTLLESHPEWIHTKDENQWQPLHEAARKGCLESVQLLLSHGANPDARTSNGGTALWWAEEYLPSSHPCLTLLRQHTQDPSLSTIPLPPHTSRQALPHKYCQVCWKEVFHYSTSHHHSVKYRNRFLTRAPHPKAAIQCKTCQGMVEELQFRIKHTQSEREKTDLLDRIKHCTYIICGECYNHQRGEHDPEHAYEIFHAPEGANSENA